MIECNPQGICSFNYRFSGDGHQASASFNWVGREGTMQIDGLFFEIKQTGLLRANWLLTDGQEIRYSARYPEIFSSRIEISGPGTVLHLYRTSFFKRQMSLVGQNYELVITPVHPFTRRARINGRYDDFVAVAFAFWLTALQWRADQSNTASPTPG